MPTDDPLQEAFKTHPRRWRSFRYVYPVIARRSRGLSIGINLNPDGACTFDCVYCCVDRGLLPPGASVDLTVLEAELRAVAANVAGLFDEPEFRAIPESYRRLCDLAFSGDGEPTAVAAFPAAVEIAAAVRRDFRLSETKIVLITNATCLARPAVAAALRVLDQNQGEIWAKLDAGTNAYYRRVNRSKVALPQVLENLLAAARVRPIVIQSMFPRLGGQVPPATEVAAYVERLRWLRDQHGQIARVQIYTVARAPAEPDVAPLDVSELEVIAAQVRGLGLAVEVFG